VSSSLRKTWQSLPPPVATAIAHLASLTAGLLAAFVLFYVLYRIGLPSKPFIYVAF
jgi:hypothetical protein